MTAPGPLLFARYAYPPNALGYCGADDTRALLEHGDARMSDGGLTELARTFEGAWPYLELIAGANRIEDPLDARVVEAYWVGNELLDRVPPRALHRHVEERFAGRLGRSGAQLADAVAGGAVPHHCFHVFAVYPWLGLLRAGIGDGPLHVLEQCRITPAVVQSVAADTLEVLARPLTWDGRTLALGPPAVREARWRDEGLAFVERPRAGSSVALHWDFVCDALDDRGSRALAAATARSLAAVNATATVEHAAG